MKNILLLTILLLSITYNLLAQSAGNIYGVVTDDNNIPLPLVNVAVLGNPGGAVTDENGHYELNIPNDITLIISASYLGYHKSEIKVYLRQGQTKKINIKLSPTATNLESFVVSDERIIRNTSLKRIDPKSAEVIPSISGSGIESLIKTLPGVSSNNEMSSQYSVRGGNFDENLVYVNDVEIYRPFLIRAGQQEGLSFINPDLVSSVLFSAGGFDARYGDKLSSALDITYKRPTQTHGGFYGSLLGGGINAEGTSKSKHFTWLAGARYKTNQYLLNSLQTKGEYRPSFSDFQAQLTYAITPKLEVALLTNYAKNRYKMVPENRTTEFGTIQEAYRLKIYFEGQEVDEFENYTSAFTTTYRPNNNVKLKFIQSIYQTWESESYDILSEYWLGRIETNLGDDEYGEVLQATGVGAFLNHSRNYLKATVMNSEHRGTLLWGENNLQWGIKYQRELIDDQLNEWYMVDSAGFSLPNPNWIPGESNPNPNLQLKNFARANNTLQSNRYSGFVQNSWNLDGELTEFSLTAGIRAQYWDVNNEFIFSPRATIAFKPNWEKDLLFRFSSGFYAQSPFYREMRRLDGSLNKNLQSQKSIHFVLGSDWNFHAWNRPFKFVSEIYYKHLEDLIPYEIDNVRLRYFANNNSKGYATGIDFRVNGEFVKGVDSWASLSFMQTKEDINDDYYLLYFNEDGERISSASTGQKVAYTEKKEIGYRPRPTNQLFHFSLFFQDYLPKNPTYKMHLNMLFGGELPIGPSGTKNYKDIYTIPGYKRVDIGFSKQLIGPQAKQPTSGPFKHIKTAWLSLEIFNLLDFSNTISYTWVTDVSGTQYGVPNRLTPRQINLKLQVKF